MDNIERLGKLYDAVADVFDAEEEIKYLDYVLLEDLLGHIAQVMEELK